MSAHLVPAVVHLLDERMSALVAELRGPMEARLANALRALGWPGEVSPMALGAESAVLTRLRAAFGALLLLQHVAGPFVTVDRAEGRRGRKVARGRRWLRRLRRRDGRSEWWRRRRRRQRRRRRRRGRAVGDGGAAATGAAAVPLPL